MNAFCRLRIGKPPRSSLRQRTDAVGPGVDSASLREKVSAMKVFLSWSGERAKLEAGALSKTRTATFVCTYLIGMGNADLEPPLGQFQWTRAEKGDTFKLLQTINGALGDSKLTDAQLQLMFEKFWPDLDAKIRALPAPLTPRDETRRKPEDLLPEILETVRAHSATLEGIRSALPSPWEKAIRDAVLAFDDVRVQPQRLPLDWETSYAGKTIGDLMRLTDDELKAIGRRHALKRMAAETKPPAGAEPPPEPPAGLGKKDEPKR